MAPRKSRLGWKCHRQRCAGTWGTSASPSGVDGKGALTTPTTTVCTPWACIRCTSNVRAPFFAMTVGGHATRGLSRPSDGSGRWRRRVAERSAARSTKRSFGNVGRCRKWWRWRRLFWARHLVTQSTRGTLAAADRRPGVRIMSPSITVRACQRAQPLQAPEPEDRRGEKGGRRYRRS